MWENNTGTEAKVRKRSSGCCGGILARPSLSGRPLSEAVKGLKYVPVVRLSNFTSSIFYPEETLEQVRRDFPIRTLTAALFTGHPSESEAWVPASA